MWPNKRAHPPTDDATDDDVDDDVDDDADDDDVDVDDESILHTLYTQ